MTSCIAQLIGSVCLRENHFLTKEDSVKAEGWAFEQQRTILDLKLEAKKNLDRIDPEILHLEKRSFCDSCFFLIRSFMKLAHVIVYFMKRIFYCVKGFFYHSEAKTWLSRYHYLERLEAFQNGYRPNYAFSFPKERLQANQNLLRSSYAASFLCIPQEKAHQPAVEEVRDVTFSNHFSAGIFQEREGQVRFYQFLSACVGDSIANWMTNHFLPLHHLAYFRLNPDGSYQLSFDTPLFAEAPSSAGRMIGGVKTYLSEIQGTIDFRDKSISFNNESIRIHKHLMTGINLYLRKIQSLDGENIKVNVEVPTGFNGWALNRVLSSQGIGVSDDNKIALDVSLKAIQRRNIHLDWQPSV